MVIMVLVNECVLITKIFVRLNIQGENGIVVLTEILKSSASIFITGMKKIKN